MTIDQFLSHSGKTLAWLADQSGVSAASMTRIARGEQNTSREVMQRIIAASDGVISAEALVHAPSSPDAAGASSEKAGGDFSRSETPLPALRATLSPEGARDSGEVLAA